MADPYGTNGSDDFDGTNGDDYLYGWAEGSSAADDIGNDKIDGLNGTDKIFGSGGDDWLSGGAGIDYLVGGVNKYSGHVSFDNGNDKMYGGSGRDWIESYGGIDTINGGGDDDTLIFDRSRATADLTLVIPSAGTAAIVQGDGSIVVSIEDFEFGGGSGNDTFMRTGTHNHIIGDRLRGGGGNDKLTGWSGRDTIAGDTGNDVLNGLDDDDRLHGGEGDDNLNGGLGDDFLEGGYTLNGIRIDSGNDKLYGGAGQDRIYSYGGIDIIDGGSGGFYGNDSLRFNRSNATADLTFIFTSSSTPTIVQGDGSSIVNVESIFFVCGSGNDTITFGAVDGDIDGHGGNDTLSGVGGRDDLVGGDGNDMLYGGGNVDLLIAGDYYDPYSTNPPTADTGNDELHGGDGDDTLVSAGGADLIDGGANNDTLFFNRRSAPADLTLQMTSFASVTLVEGDGSRFLNVETLKYHGGGGIDTVTAFDGDDTLHGFGGNDVLNGGGGNDGIEGGAGNDLEYGGAGDDTITSYSGVDIIDGGANSDTLIFNRQSATNSLKFAMASFGAVTTVLGDGTSVVNVENFNFTGGSGGDWIAVLGGDDKLFGLGGNDVLSGGGGTNHLYGGKGDDTYVVSASVKTYVLEEANGGSDVVEASVSFALVSYHLENLTLTGSGNINGMGNRGVNTIIGNGGNNVLNGSTGDDVMRGGNGSDTYYVDTAGDVVNEAGSGTDSVRSAINFTLGANLEKLYLLEGATNGIGNGLANVIYGNSGDNLLDGSAGDDQLVGYGGNDRYVVDSLYDRIYETIGGEAGGIDIVYATVHHTLSVNVERLGLLGTLNIHGTGNGAANSVSGNSGNNFVDGKLGADSLFGGLGVDNFVFSTALSAGNVDYIWDFTAADDTIRIDNAVFAGLANGYLAVAAFHTGSAALDASDRIVYDSATGALYFDADGAGGVAQIQFATLVAGLALTNADIYVF